MWSRKIKLALVVISIKLQHSVHTLIWHPDILTIDNVWHVWQLTFGQGIFICSLCANVSILNNHSLISPQWTFVLLLFFLCLCYKSEVFFCLFWPSDTLLSFHLQNSLFEESLLQRSLLLKTKRTSPDHCLSSRGRVSRSLFRKSSHLWHLCVHEWKHVLYVGVYALYKCVCINLLLRQRPNWNGSTCVYKCLIWEALHGLKHHVWNKETQLFFSSSLLLAF